MTWNSSRTRIVVVNGGRAESRCAAPVKGKHRAAESRPAAWAAVKAGRACGASGARRGRQRLGLGGALPLEQVGQQEGEIDRLLRIEPRIAHRVVAVVEIGLGD